MCLLLRGLYALFSEQDIKATLYSPVCILYNMAIVISAVSVSVAVHYHFRSVLWLSYFSKVFPRAKRCQTAITVLFDKLQLGDLVHEVKKSLGQPFNCKCCYDKIDVEAIDEKSEMVEMMEIKTEENEESKEETEVKEEINEEEPPTDVIKVAAPQPVKRTRYCCPICPESPNFDDHWKFGLHMMPHFEKELGECIVRGPVYKCRKCESFQSDQRPAAMLHVGFEHGEFDRYKNQKFIANNLHVV